MTDGRFEVSNDPPDQKTMDAEVQAAMMNGEFILLMLGDASEGNIRRDDLRTAWNALDNLRRAVLVWTLGLNGHPKATMEEVGEGIGKSRTEVKALRDEALGQLRGRMPEFRA
jgi:hypothetical protein